MGLLIGAAILRKIAEFAERFDGLPISIHELKITLRFPSFELVFVQQERYDQRIISHIEFEPGVGFFLEDIVAACCGLDETIHVAIPNISAHSEILSATSDTSVKSLNLFRKISLASRRYRRPGLRLRWKFQIRRRESISQNSQTKTSQENGGC